MQRIVKPLVNGRSLAFAAIASTAFAILLFGLSYWLESLGILFQAFLLASAVICVLLAILSTWGAWFMLRLERRRHRKHRHGAPYSFRQVHPL